MAKSKVQKHTKALNGNDLEISKTTISHPDNSSLGVKATAPNLTKTSQDEDKHAFRITIPPSTTSQKEIIQQEAEKTDSPQLTLQIEDLLQKRQSKNRSSWQYRTIIAPFDITELEIHPTKAHPGEIVTISFKATNSSNALSIYPIILKINGEVLAAEILSIPPGVVLPINISLSGTLHGNYIVKIDNLTGKFAILDDPRSDDKADGCSPEKSESANKIGLGLTVTEIETYLIQQEISKHDITTSGKMQSIIDKVAYFIEFGLDKMGNGLMLPIEGLAKLFALLSKIKNQTSKKRHNG